VDAYLINSTIIQKNNNITEGAAMKPESKLLIVEMIVPFGNQPSIAKLLDLEMLVTTGGCERTEKEFEILLQTSGFKLTRTIATKESTSVIEGIRL
jgi:hypothetical protein